MKKVVLVDGNNLLFRSYYATAYSGSIMRNSKGLPTNALYGFVGMINKIITEEEPTYMMVAFDIGKNFRKEKYDFYKEGRSATPDELKMQMPIARTILDAMGIKYVELAPYEADDIIGTVAKIAESNPDYYSLIVSSDKDLLQLISFETEVKLLKQSGFIRYNEESFEKDYGIKPINIIDLKALMGDASDNIPGVKGIGEKTALKLLQEYKTLDGIYENIDSIKGKTQEKLLLDKDNAYMSYEIATIYRDVPINVNFEEFLYKGPDVIKLKEVYEELEFYSLLKNIVVEKQEKEEIKYQVVKDLNTIKLDDTVAFYLEVDDINYHNGEILGMGISDQNNNYYIPRELVNEAIDLLNGKNVITYDLKKSLIVTKKDIPCTFDLMIAAYLEDEDSSEDITKLMNHYNYECVSYEDLKKNNFTRIDNIITLKSKFILDNYLSFQDRLINDGQISILNNIEMPLIKVLASMEANGFKFDREPLKKMKEEITLKIEEITKEIYALSGEEFNISSPMQLGNVLWEKMALGKVGKTHRGYKTDVKTLQKYQDKHPIINKVLEYRNLTKLLSTYIDGLEEYVASDGKIHTIFNQTLTRTGRLSSMEPN